MSVIRFRHRCLLPVLDEQGRELGVGTIWRCDECQAIKHLHFIGPDTDGRPGTRYWEALDVTLSRPWTVGR